MCDADLLDLMYNGKNKWTEQIANGLNPQES